jgi:hypothetical protein
MDERGTIDGGRQAGSPDVAPEDEAATTDAQTGDEGREVGLGRVIEDHLASATPDPDDPVGLERSPGTRDITEASEQSFPASDPPGLTGTRATDRTRSG